jgi:hypothetical protein
VFSPGNLVLGLEFLKNARSEIVLSSCCVFSMLTHLTNTIAQQSPVANRFKNLNQRFAVTSEDIRAIFGNKIGLGF